MLDPQLSQYIHSARANNIPDAQIRENLLKTGWSESVINEALSLEKEKKGIPVPAKLMGPVELMRSSWRLFRSRWATLIILGFLPSLVTFLFSLIFVLGTTFIVNPLNILGANGPNLQYIWTYIIGAIVLLLTLMVLQTWGSIAQLTAISSQHPTGVRASFAHAWKFIRSFWWLLTVMFFVVMGGFMLFVVPGIIYSVWFAFSYFILIDEEHKGIRAMIRSREYVRGLWWPVLGRLLIPMLLLIPFGIIYSYIKDTLGQEGLASFLNLLFSLIGTPLYLCYNYLVFDNVRSYKANNIPDPRTQKRYPYILVGLVGLVFVFILPVVVLAAINPLKQINSARNSQAKAELMNLRMAIELYRIENNVCPNSLEDLVPEYRSQLPANDDAIQYTYKVSSADDSCTVCAQPKGSSSPDNCYTFTNLPPVKTMPTDLPNPYLEGQYQ